MRNGGFSASYDSYVVGSSAVFRLNPESFRDAKNPRLRQSPKRCTALKKQILSKRLNITGVFSLAGTLD